MAAGSYDVDASKADVLVREIGTSVSDATDRLGAPKSLGGGEVVPAAGSRPDRMAWDLRRTGGHVDGEDITTLHLDAAPRGIRYLQLSLHLPAVGQDVFAVRNIYAIGPAVCDAKGRAMVDVAAEALAAESIQALVHADTNTNTAPTLVKESLHAGKPREEPPSSPSHPRVSEHSHGFELVQQQKERNLRAAAEALPSERGFP